MKFRSLFKFNYKSITHFIDNNSGIVIGYFVICLKMYFHVIINTNYFSRNLPTVKKETHKQIILHFYQ